MRRSHIFALLLLCLGAAVRPVLAWDGVQTMVPTTIDVTAGSNYWTAVAIAIWGTYLRPERETPKSCERAGVARGRGG